MSENGYAFNWLSNSKEEIKMSNELVFVENNQVLTDSRKVAEYFEKNHRDVLRAIDNIINELDVRNFAQMFFESTKPDSYGREQRIYLMNRDGFSLLVMGFTGKEAMGWKLKYIAAFNVMEEELKKQHEQPKQTKVERFYPVADMMRDIRDTKSVMLELGVSDGIAMAKAISLVEKYNQFDLSEVKSLIPSTTEETGYLTPTKIGNELGVSNRQINKVLRDLGFQYKSNNEWQLTELGKQYGEKFPYENNGHSGYQIRWQKEIVNIVRKHLS